MICSSCNREISQGSAFCIHCGKRVCDGNEAMRSAGFTAAGDLGGDPSPRQPSEPEIRYSPGFGTNAGARPAPPKAEKRCTACGAAVREGLRFCSLCGAAVSPESAPPPEPVSPMFMPAPSVITEVPPVPPVPEETKTEPVPRTPVTDIRRAEAFSAAETGYAPPAPAAPQAPVIGAVPVTPAPVQPVPVAPAPVQPAPVVMAENDPTPEKKKKPRWLIPVLLVVLLAAVITAGLFTDWFGLVSPFYRIGAASAELMEADSFTVKVTAVVAEQKIEGDILVQQDRARKELSVYGDLQLNRIDFLVGIYKGNLVISAGEGLELVTDVSEALEVYFELLEKDHQKALDFLVELILKNETLEQLLDPNGTRECLQKALTTMGSTSWLKKNAGYHAEWQDGTKRYVFEPGLGDLAVEGLKLFENAFTDKDSYLQAMSAARQERNSLNGEMDLYLCFEVQSGKLTGITLEEGRTDLSLELTFEQIGSTRVPTGELEKILKRNS